MKPSDTDQHPIIVIGAGITGLACATYLKEADHHVTVLDMSDRVGGRIKTDEVDGFKLDHGFQVLQTAYPEARKLLDYDKLNLHPFDPGALIYTRDADRPHQPLKLMSDPWRKPGQATKTFFNGVGTYMDRFKMALLRLRLLTCQEEEDARFGEMTTYVYLERHVGLSKDVIERFFRPWFAGVFLETQLQTSARVFRYVFRMLARGDAALPANGMQAIPDQLADRIGRSHILLNHRAIGLEGNKLVAVNGQNEKRSLAFSHLVVAVDQFSRFDFLKKIKPLSNFNDDVPGSNLTSGVESSDACGTTCLYFEAPKSPVIHKKLLILNGERQGPVNHLCVLSDVCRDYAPNDQTLVSVSVVSDPESNQQVDEDALRARVAEQLADMLNTPVNDWRHIKTYHVAKALPGQLASVTTPAEPVRLREDITLCGGDTASINTSMLAGRKTAGSFQRG